MGKKTLWAIIVLLILFGGSFLFGVSVYLVSSSDSNASIFESGNVGLVKIEGGIYEPMDTLKELDEYRRDDDIKAVVVRIESPGGSVSASQELFGAIKRLSEKKPVVASMGSVAASGGYYAACGATKIVANPGTITGSIGVRMEHVNVGELLRWAKIGHETLKSGKYKDLASPDRPLTEDEKKILGDLIADIHRQFKRTVEASRGLTEEVVDLLADGRVYSGEDAQMKGLVDQLGDYFDAVKLAGELAGIKGEPKVVEKHKKGKKIVEKFFEGALTEIRSAVLKSDQTQNVPMLLYQIY
jgi:protease-4